MNRPIDRADDPSPFAWIFAGALALLGAGTVLAARRNRRALQDQMAHEDDASESVEGHPS